MLVYNPWWNWFLPYYNSMCCYAYPSYGNIFNTESAVGKFNRQYFRPACLPALNVRNMSNFINNYYNQDYSKINLPDYAFISPGNTILNFYSVLREASNLPSGAAPGGSVGYEKGPYPIAYNFLSKSYKDKISYDEFLNNFFHTGHINLIKLIKVDLNPNSIDADNYLVELETIKTGSSFYYSYGWIQVEEEQGNYKIKNIDLLPEDFFYPGYHGWMHNAELYVEYWHGMAENNFVKTKYPTLFDGYTKKIYIKGTDGNTYLFKFAHLTNGTDIEIGQYKLLNGQWINIRIKKKSVTLEDAMQKIEGNKELQEKFVKNPKGTLEELGVDTSNLTITPTNGFLGGWQHCFDICPEVKGVKVGGYKPLYVPEPKLPKPEPKPPEPKPPKPEPKPKKPKPKPPKIKPKPLKPEPKHKPPKPLKPPGW